METKYRLDSAQQLLPKKTLTESGMVQLIMRIY